jgi:hypothetical protein
MKGKLNRKTLKRLALHILFVLAAACSPTSGTQPSLTAVSLPEESSVLSSSGDSYEIEAWVSDPNPARDEQVFVYGSLIRNGVRVGGMMMQAYWPDEKQAPGIPGCNVLVIYGAGGCILEASEFPVGEYVPVRVQFEYYGKTYSGETGFIPQ